MKKLKIAFIGCGRISGLHAAGYRDNPDAELAVVCDSDLATARARASEWGVARATDSFEDVLADPEIDAVEVLVPTDLHEQMTIRALKAGKHVSVQKPMATSLASADRMTQAATKAGKLLKVAENFVFYPPLVLAKKLIDGGAIGEPSSLRMKMISGGAGGWKVPDSAWAWRLKDFAAGMGLNTFDHGHHMWASAWYLLGEIDKVEAWVDETDGIVDSPAVVQWKYCAPKRYGQCEFQYGSELVLPSPYYADTEWFDVAGSRGVLTVNRGTTGICAGPAVSVFADGAWKGYESENDWAAGFAGSTKNFVAAVLGREPPRLSMEEGRHILAVDIAIAKSDRESRAVYVDELDARFPSLYAAARRRKDRTAKATFFASISRSDKVNSKRNGARARELTFGLAERFKPEEAQGLAADVGLVLTDASPCGGSYVLKFHDGRVEITEEALPKNALLTIRVCADVWADILLGKRRIETSYLRGKLRFEGEGAQALRLRNIFGL
jgi:predicted dehydrogenase/putative sterol carrier protein